MATFRQDETQYEDGVGDVTLSYLFSDSWDGLFTDESYSINVVIPSRIKFEREKAIGQLAQNQFKFSVSEASFSKDSVTLIDDPKTQPDIEQEFLNLCTSSTTGNLAFVGIFLNTSSTPAIDEALYIGAINSKFSFDDIVWRDGQFGVTPNPLRVFEFECTPGQEAVLDEKKFSAIIANIDPAWESLYVIDAPGFYQDSIFRTTIPRLVLSRYLFEELSRSYVELLDADGYGDWTIEWGLSKMDGKYSPTRWKRPYADKIYGPFVGGLLINNKALVPATIVDGGTTIYDDEARDLYICGVVSGADTKHPYVPYCVVKAAENSENDRNEYNLSAAKENEWANIDRVDDTFTGFLYSLATDLGMSINIELTGQRDIKITFVSKVAKASTSKIYIKDVTKASGEISDVEKREESRKLQGSIGYLIAEPNNEWPASVFNSLNPHTPEDGHPLRLKGYRDEGVKNLVSIGRTFWEVKDNLTNNSGVNGLLIKNPTYNRSVLVAARIPYYMYMSNSTGGKDFSGNYIGNAVPYNSVSFSNQLYIKVDKRAGETLCPDEYYTTVGRLEIKRNGEDRYYYSLADYVNGINTEDLQKYGTKYKLDIPFLMCASNSDTGSSPSIMNLAIDKTIEIDGLDYVVDSYEIDLIKRAVKLELSAQGRYDFGTATGITDNKDNEVQGVGGGESGEIPATNLAGLTLLNSGIKKGEFVSRVGEDTVERSFSKIAHYGRLLGVANHDADEDDYLAVQTSGKVVIDWLSGSINAPVFVRKVDADENLSTTPLVVTNADEDLYAEVGKIVGTNTMEINIKEHFVLQ